MNATGVLSSQLPSIIMVEATSKGHQNDIGNHEGSLTPLHTGFAYWGEYMQCVGITTGCPPPLLCRHQSDHPGPAV